MRLTLLSLLGILAVICMDRPLNALDGYIDRVIDDRMVHFDAGYRTAEDQQVRQAFDVVLADQIAKLARLPEAARTVIKPVEIFVSSGTHRAFGAQHHPSAAWLAANGYPAAFARNVEICNWKEFTTLVVDQPFCLLHEMAHAYHDRMPSIDASIRTAYEHAQSAGLYLTVTRQHGTALVKAYAITNYHEYFAELSEAYFGQNDFFPYDRAELQAYDAEGFAMVATAWGAH